MALVEPRIATTASDPVRQIADAVLYEGYILWPYRRTAVKNQQRWTFGGVYPEAHAATRGGVDDHATMRTECLLEGDAETRLGVGVRFLHVVERQVLEATPDGERPVDELEVGDQRHVSWDEATERELVLDDLGLDALARAPRTLEIDIEAGTEREPLVDPAGATTGAVRRSWRALTGSIEVSAVPLEPGLHRVAALVSNTSPWRGADRADALRQTFCSTHAVLRAEGGRFVSLTDPPAELADAAAGCENRGVWPVLAGEQGDRGVVLASPIILSDYPAIAPESPGDLFDGGEIDQLLVLNILSMTDDERREMRDSDPRAREILERTEALSPDELMSLHGAIREFGMVR